MTFQDPAAPEVMKIFIHWLNIAFPGIVNAQLFCKNEDCQISFRTKRIGTNNYVSNNEEIHKYILTYLSDALLPLPEVLHDVIGIHMLQGEKLLERLIQDSQTKPECLREMVAIVQKNGNDQHKQKLLGYVKPIDLANVIELNSVNYFILKLCFSISSDQLRIQTLGMLTSITHDGITTLLRDIQNKGADTLIVNQQKKGKLKFSIDELLGGNANVINKLLASVAQHWLELEFDSHDKIAFLLGINREQKPEMVWKRFTQTLKDGRIENSQQLVFIWAIGNIDEMLLLHPKVETLGGWMPLSGSFFIQPLKFLPNTKILQEKYIISPEIVQDNELLNSKIWTLQTSPYLAGVHW